MPVPKKTRLGKSKRTGCFSRVKRLCQRLVEGKSLIGWGRRDWSELIGKKNGEIKGQEFYLDRESPYLHLAVTVWTASNE